MKFTSSSTIVAVAALAALAVPVATAAPGPAPLEPPFVGFCQWKMQGPEVVLSSPAGIPIRMTTDGGRGFTKGAFQSADGYSFHGPASGGIIEGTNQLDFQSEFTGGGGNPLITYHSHFTGSINQNGSAQGTVVDDKGETKNWSTNTGFVCMP